MPFVSTWTEELVAEWLQLEGYMVETRLPGLSVPGGGRYEPDVVGVRMDNGRLKIRHCEVAAGLIGNPKTTGERYAKKFSPEVCEWVTAHFRELFGIEKGKECDYEKWVIANASVEMKEALRRNVMDLHLERFDDFIPGTVLPSIRAWQDKMKTPKNPRPTLSQGLWLLRLLVQLLDYVDPDKKTLASRQAR